MQNKDVDPESSMDKSINMRALELILENYVVRNKRYKYLNDKYRKERACLLDLSQKLKTLHRKINNLCVKMLSTTLNLNARSEAVVVAILNNMAAEKAAVDDLFANFKTPYANIEDDFGHFEYLLSEHFNDLLGPEDMTEAESMLTDLRNEVVAMNEMVSEIYRKCYLFIGTLERTLKKIEAVSKR